jgi:hypothetical protein
MLVRPAATSRMTGGRTPLLDQYDLEAERLHHDITSAERRSLHHAFEVRPGVGPFP